MFVDKEKLSEFIVITSALKEKIKGENELDRSMEM